MRAQVYSIVAVVCAVASLASAVLVTAPGGSAMAVACLAHFGVTLFSVIALVTSPGWSRGPRMARELTAISVLRFLARVTPVLLVAQVLLGSAYRHKLLGLLPHAIGALTAGVLALAFGVFAAVGCADHPAIRTAARSLAVLTATQILLGIGAALVRISESEASALLAMAPTAHVVTGSLTLASSVILAIQVLRNVQVPEGALSGSRATVAP